MSELTHKAERVAFGKGIDAVIKHINKDRENICITEYVKYVQ